MIKKTLKWLAAIIFCILIFTGGVFLGVLVENERFFNTLIEICTQEGEVLRNEHHSGTRVWDCVLRNRVYMR